MRYASRQHEIALRQRVKIATFMLDCPDNAVAALAQRVIIEFDRTGDIRRFPAILRDLYNAYWE